MSPPVQPNGLPRVSRYTNSAQLDFMLSRYRSVAEQAASPSPSASSAPSGTASSPGDLLEQACLGWERALFDLQSARRYPALLRLSTESANLAEVFRDLPRLAQRSPRPEACGPVAAGEHGPHGATPDASKPADAAPASPAPGEGAAQAGAPVAAPATAQTDGVTSPTPLLTPQTGQAPPAAPASQVATAPPPASTAGAAAPARSESKAAAERHALDQLRTALGMSIAPPKHFAETFADPTVPLPVGAPVDLATLRALADSELPIIRLRARFHLLGLCTLAVEASDRFGQPLVGEGSAAAGPAAGGKVGPTDASVCGELRPGDTLRHAQRRLLTSLLSAWRVKYPEPMSDLVVALANFASRDNPVVDGPRAAR